MTYNSRDMARQHATIHEAYHALDDYLIEHAGTFDLSAGLDRLLTTAANSSDAANATVSTASTLATPEQDAPRPPSGAPVRRRRRFTDLLTRLAGAQPDVL